MISGASDNKRVRTMCFDNGGYIGMHFPANVFINQKGFTMFG
jgi:hypothetical protein